MDFQYFIQPIAQVSTGSAILTQEGVRAHYEGDWNATNEEENFISQNRIMFLCSSTNIYYNHSEFWTKRIDSYTISAKQNQSNDRIIIKKTQEIRSVGKCFFVCAHYIEGQNDYNSVLSAVNTVARDLDFQAVCTLCGQIITKKECVYYSQCPYHKKCIRCSKCNCEPPDDAKVDDFTNVNGTFLCTQHYNESLISNNLNDEEKQKYIEETKKNYVKKIFKIPFETKESTGSQAHDSLSISETEVTVPKVVQDLVPSISVNINSSPENLDPDKLEEALGEDVGFLGFEDNEGDSTIFKILLFSSVDLEHDEIEESHKAYINNVKGKLETTIKDTALIGNFGEKPVISLKSNVPKGAIQESINKRSMNQLKVLMDVSDEESSKMEKEIINEIMNKKDNNKNFKHILSNKKLYDELDAQLRKDLEDNPYELIVVGISGIASKYLDEYYEIKGQIPPEKVHEGSLYHGSDIGNHSKIANSHFLNPAKDDMKGKKVTDEGFYGKGIYSTDNAFYAALYGKEKKNTILGVTEKANLLGCRVIYYEDKVKDLYEQVEDYKKLSYYGKKIDDDIVENFGANHALVGSKRKFLPILEKDKDQSIIYANEYVLPNSCQIIPCYSFTVMRTDHYVLWKDDKVDLQFLKKISKETEVNVYHKDNVEDAVALIKKKKYAALKLITNASDAENLIKQARKIIGSNFVCLVFDDENDQNNNMKWVSEMENVLLTRDSKDLQEFAKLEMNINKLLEFVEKLKKESNNIKFKINEGELLHFPNCDRRDVFYLTYYNKQKGNQNQNNANQNNQNQNNANQDNQNQNNANQNNQNQNNANQDNQSKNENQNNQSKNESLLKKFIGNITSLFW